MEILGGLVYLLGDRLSRPTDQNWWIRKSTVKKGWLTSARWSVFVDQWTCSEVAYLWESGVRDRPPVPLSSNSGEGQSALIGDRSPQVPISPAMGQSRHLSVPILAPAVGSTMMSKLYLVQFGSILV